MHVAQAAVGTQHAVAAFIPALAVQRLLQAGQHALGVVGVQPALEELEARLDRARLVAPQPVVLARPVQLVAGGHPVEAAQVHQGFGLGQLPGAPFELLQALGQQLLLHVIAAGLGRGPAPPQRTRGAQQQQAAQAQGFSGRRGQREPRAHHQGAG